MEEAGGEEGESGLPLRAYLYIVVGSVLVSAVTYFMIEHGVRVLKLQINARTEPVRMAFSSEQQAESEAPHLQELQESNEEAAEKEAEL